MNLPSIVERFIYIYIYVYFKLYLEYLYPVIDFQRFIKLFI